MGIFSRFPNRHWLRMYRGRNACRKGHARKPEETRDAIDAARLGPIVMLGNDWKRREGLVRLSMPEPMRHGETVTRRVRIGDGLEVVARIEIIGGGAGRVWLDDPAAAVRALEEEVYRAACDLDDLEAPGADPSDAYREANNRAGATASGSGVGGA